MSKYQLNIAFNIILSSRTPKVAVQKDQAHSTSTI
jgi:hypothetical protein